MEKEIKIRHIGENNTDLLVEFYQDGKLKDWVIETDTKYLPDRISSFLYGEYEIEHN